MKRTMTCLAASVMMMAALSVAGADGAWLTDFEVAKAAAEEKGAPILVNFSGSDWCGWCIRLEREVFSKEEFLAYAEDNLVLFLADFPRVKAQSDKVRDQNAELAKRYGIQGFPTVLLLDAQGRELARTGYRAGGVTVYLEHLSALTRGE